VDSLHGSINQLKTRIYWRPGKRHHHPLYWCQCDHLPPIDCTQRCGWCNDDVRFCAHFQGGRWL